jgi:16S rRNA (uracil1498-N3)-methyltransferase
MIIFKKNIESLEFSSDDSHIKTLRPKMGAVLRLTNLEGSIYTIEVINYDFKSGKGIYKIINHIITPKPIPRTIIQSVIDKNYLDKLFEIVPIVNITNVVLVESEYSNVPNINLERLESIMIRACEQSENVFKPTIKLIVKQKLVQYLQSESIVGTVLELPEKNSNQLDSKLDTIIVGPEGGFSNNEIDFFVKNNYPFYSIKCNVLPAWLAGFGYYIGI